MDSNATERHRICFWFTIGGQPHRWETVVTIRTDDPITDVYDIGETRLSEMFGDVESWLAEIREQRS